MHQIIRDVELTEKELWLNRCSDKAPTDQSGHAEVISNYQGHQIAYSESLGWLYWNGMYWERNKHKVKTIVVETLRAREELTMKLYSKKVDGREFAANVGNVNGILSFLEGLVKVDDSKIDAHDDLLPAPNGIIDLRTGKLLDHDSRKFFTYTTTVEYNEKADYTEWINFIKESIGGNEETLEALQIFTGYMLTGDTREEKLLYIYGPTRSGKGTYTETIKSLLPNPIAQERDFNTFTAKRDGDTNNFDLASLRSARMVFASESQRYQVLNPAKVKAMTGGNDTWAAYKGKDGFTYRPKFKICLTSNFEVNADVDDDAVWSRLIVVTFPRSHLGHEDTSLKGKFKTVSMQQGVLRWATEGTVKWYQRGGLLVPESFKTSLQEQRNKLDSVEQWLDECTEKNDAAFVTNVRLRTSYQDWCKANGIEPKQDRAFSLSLEHKGYKLVKQTDYVYNPYTRVTNYLVKKQQRGVIGLELK